MDEFAPEITDEWDQLIRDVEEGEQVAILRGDEAVAVLISIDRYDELLADLERLSGEPSDVG